MGLSGDVEVPQQSQQNMSSLSNKTSLNSRHKSNIKGKTHTLKRVTLTDLCPEEKGKIGELILLIQKHRKDNDRLTRQNNQLQTSNQQLNQTLARLKFQNQTQETKVKELGILISDLREHMSSKEAEFKKYERDVNKMLVDRQVQVEIARKQKTPIQSPIMSVKHKSIDIQIQTQENSPLRYSQKKQCQHKQPQVKRTSKAYKKIMKGLTSIGKAVDDRFSKQSHESIQSNASQIQGDEDFSTLARLWLKIKKQNAEEDNLVHKYQRSTHSLQQGEYSQLVNHYKRIKVPEVPISMDGEIDQDDLNKMLKKGQFKASSMLRQGGRGQQSRGQPRYL